MSSEWLYYQSVVFNLDKDYLLMDNTALSMKSEFDGLIGV